MDFKNKKILITAGPTWIPIDRVRVISNTATAKTGILLAEELQRRGAKVNLLLGPVESCCISSEINLKRFRFFDDLKNLVKRELRSKQYDIVIHSAAVSDYKPKTYCRRKIKSGISRLRIEFEPTPKLIDAIKEIGRSALLVGFKFEPQANKKELIDKARGLIRRSGADLVVANTDHNGRYNAYIVSQEKVSGAIKSKEGLARILIKEIGDALCQNRN